jgi:hypothetical protein
MLTAIVGIVIAQSGVVKLSPASLKDLQVSWRGVKELHAGKSGKVTVRFTCFLQNNTPYAVKAFKFRVILYGSRTWQADKEITSFKDPVTSKMGKLAFGRKVNLQCDVDAPQDVWRTTHAYWIEPLSATGTPLPNVTAWQALTALPLKGKSSPISFGTASDMTGGGFSIFRNQVQGGPGAFSWYDGPSGGRIDANTRGRVGDDKRLLGDPTGHEDAERRLHARPGDDGRPIDIRFTAPRDGLYLISLYGYLVDGAMANALVTVDGKKKYTSPLRNDGSGLQTEFPIALQKGHHVDFVWARFTKIDAIRIGFDLKVIGGPNG